MRLLPARATWYCSTDCARMLTSQGLGRLKDILSSMPKNPAGKHRHKDVRQVVLTGAGTSRVVYIKRQWAWDRSLPRWSDLRDGVAGRSDPVNEWRGLSALAAAGLDVPEPWVLFRDPRPLSPRAALIMSAVPVTSSLSDLVSSGWIERLDHAERASVATAVAAVVHRIEAAGLRWRSMKAKHFYPEQTADEACRMWLIDCEGVRAALCHRQNRRDREALLRSLELAGAPVAFVSQLVSALLRPPDDLASGSHGASTWHESAASAA